MHVNVNLNGKPASVNGNSYWVSSFNHDRIKVQGDFIRATRVTDKLQNIDTFMQCFTVAMALELYYLECVKPVAYASRTISYQCRKKLQPAGRRVSFVIGVTKFHNYLFSQTLTLCMDHKSDPCKASSMNPSQFLVWHLLAYNGGHSHLLL